MTKYFVGDDVYIYSTTLDEIIYGRVEGHEGEENTRVKILQETSEGILRHVVSTAYVFTTESEALKAKEEHELLSLESPIDYQAGYVVHLYNGTSIVTDKYGEPLLYQITAVYRDKSKVSLVTSYGESVGLYDYSSIRLVSRKPIFTKDMYDLYEKVIWIEGDDVFEGKITTLHESKAEVSDVKKLYPLDYRKRVPYYKLTKSDPEEENTSRILYTIIGDTL